MITKHSVKKLCTPTNSGGPYVHVSTYKYAQLYIFIYLNMYVHVTVNTHLLSFFP